MICGLLFSGVALYRDVRSLLYSAMLECNCVVLFTCMLFIALLYDIIWERSRVALCLYCACEGVILERYVRVFRSRVCVSVYGVFECSAIASFF